MAIKYVSTAALSELVTQIKAITDTKVDKVVGKALSTNDLTNELKANYDAAYTHSQSAHCPSDAERNIIVGMTMNGTAITVGDDRIAALTSATKTSHLTNDSDFQDGDAVDATIATALTAYYTSTQTDTAIATAVASAATLSFEVVESLPEIGSADTKKIYLVANTDTGLGPVSGDVYKEYMVINGAWELLGDTSMNMSNYYTKAEVDSAISAALADYVLTADMVQITAAEVTALFA